MLPNWAPAQTWAHQELTHLSLEQDLWVKQTEATNALRKFVLLNLSNISPDTTVYTINLPSKLFPLTPHVLIELLSAGHLLRSLVYLCPTTDQRKKSSFLPGTEKETEMQSGLLTCPRSETETLIFGFQSQCFWHDVMIVPKKKPQSSFGQQTCISNQ